MLARQDGLEPLFHQLLAGSVKSHRPFKSAHASVTSSGRRRSRQVLMGTGPSAFGSARRRKPFPKGGPGFKSRRLQIGFHIAAELQHRKHFPAFVRHGAEGLPPIEAGGVRVRPFDTASPLVTA